MAIKEIIILFCQLKKIVMRIFLYSFLFLIFILLSVYGGRQGISCTNHHLYNTGIYGVMLAASIDENILGINPIINYNTINQFKKDILHYDLSIEIDFNKKKIYGNSIITGIITDSTLQYIDLNFYDNMKITTLFFNDSATGYNHRNNIITIPSSATINDTFRIKIKYEGKPKSRGFGSFTFGKFEGKDILYTLNEPVYASTWFPCNDLPSDKALLDIRITTDSSKKSVSNGNLIATDVNGDKKTYHWKTFYPIAPYLISFYSSEYEKYSEDFISSVTGDTMKIYYYVFPGRIEKAMKDFEDHQKYLHFFEKSFGAYPFIKEKYGIAEFLWRFGAMEHQTITGIGYNYVTGNKFYSDLLIHELAHHWWGNSVTLSTWDDIWLNEGFSTYSEALYYEFESGKAALQSSMRNNFSRNFQGTLYAPAKTFGNTVYKKGAWVLHMLRYEVGDSLFFSIMRTYYERFKYKNATTHDFLVVCNEVSGKDLSEFFQQWVFEGEGICELVYEWNLSYIDSIYNIEFNINQVQKGFDSYKLKLDVKIIFEDDSTLNTKVVIDKRMNSFLLETEKKPVKIILDNDEHLLAYIINKINIE